MFEGTCFFWCPLVILICQHKYSTCVHFGVVHSEYLLYSRVCGSLMFFGVFYRRITGKREVSQKSIKLSAISQVHVPLKSCLPHSFTIHSTNIYIERTHSLLQSNYLGGFSSYTPPVYTSLKHQF